MTPCSDVSSSAEICAAGQERLLSASGGEIHKGIAARDPQRLQRGGLAAPLPPHPRRPKPSCSHHLSERRTADPPSGGGEQESLTLQGIQYGRHYFFFKWDFDLEWDEEAERVFSSDIRSESGLHIVSELPRAADRIDGVAHHESVGVCYMELWVWISQGVFSGMIRG